MSTIIYVTQKNILIENLILIKRMYIVIGILCLLLIYILIPKLMFRLYIWNLKKGLNQRRDLICRFESIIDEIEDKAKTLGKVNQNKLKKIVNELHNTLNLFIALHESLQMVYDRMIVANKIKKRDTNLIYQYCDIISPSKRGSGLRTLQQFIAKYMEIVILINNRVIDKSNMLTELLESGFLQSIEKDNSENKTGLNSVIDKIESEVNALDQWIAIENGQTGDS